MFWITRSQPIFLKHYLPISCVFDVISTLLLIQMSYLLCYQQTMQELKTYMSLKQLFLRIIMRRRVQPVAPNGNDSFTRY
ncbi:hypothetical protein CRE_05023 [Caenorhabditis remanei]|uniref:Uncharacterized protein n=2 Tax=Caenorhabditis remanei TaxID=31234 RepID=E3MZ29_CAERE|nr:hypothetical protein CRE_05023 [Caenorhabditis remanei]